MDKSIVKLLRDTHRRFGSVYPIIVSQDGEVIDGKHRLQVGDWEVRKLPINDRKDILALRIVLNVVRRYVSHEEKSAWVNELAEILLQRGVEKEALAEAISKETGVSRWWVYKYLDRRFKVLTKPVEREIGYRPIPPYRRITIYLDNYTGTLLDNLTSERKFKDCSETAVWLIKEAMIMLRKLNPNEDYAIADKPQNMLKDEKGEKVDV